VESKLRSRKARLSSLENENVDEKICRRAKKSKKSSSLVAVGAAENRAAGLTARYCDAGLTLTWFGAALLDGNGSPDLPDKHDRVSLRFSSSLVSILWSIYI